MNSGPVGAATAFQHVATADLDFQDAAVDLHGQDNYLPTEEKCRCQSEFLIQ